jgi:hypothetical protein
LRAAVRRGRPAFPRRLTLDLTRKRPEFGLDTVVANTELNWKLKLRVTPAGGAPCETELKDRWPQLSPPQVGTIVPVFHDPADPSKVTLDHDPDAVKRANAQFASGLVKDGMLRSGRSVADADAVAANTILAKTGTPPTAVITEATDTGKTGLPHDGRELELKIDVTLPDGTV